VKKYLSFFRLRFVMGLQYRGAAAAGIVTQFFWGFMEILMFHAFYEADPSAYPMTLEATSDYVWLQQAFLAFFGAWIFETEIFDVILNGNIAYELCRPIRIYDMWFARSVANRLSKGLLRCMPILVVAVFLPETYGIGAPASALHFALFLVTLALGLLVMAAMGMVLYALTLFTTSSQGLKFLYISLVEFFAGQVIPLPFFPKRLQAVMEFLPFASMANVPLRIYSGNLEGAGLARAIALQIFWLFLLVLTGRILCGRGEKRAVLQGG